MDMDRVELKYIFSSRQMPCDDDFCVYSLVTDDEEIVYIGQTSNLKRRICQHVANGKEFNFVEWCLFDKTELGNEEAKAIVKYSPRMNKTLPKNDLYMTLGSLRTEIQKAIDTTLDKLDIVFENYKSAKYITSRDYEKVMVLVNEFDFELKAVIKKELSSETQD